MTLLRRAFSSRSSRCWEVRLRLRLRLRFLPLPFDRLVRTCLHGLRSKLFHTITAEPGRTNPRIILLCLTQDLHERHEIVYSQEIEFQWYSLSLSVALE